MVGFIAPSIHFNNFTPPSPHKAAQINPDAEWFYFPVPFFMWGQGLPKGKKWNSLRRRHTHTEGRTQFIIELPGLWEST